jgi:parvulin-like peptidyl-prolyl isomerase
MKIAFPLGLLALATCAFAQANPPAPAKAKTAPAPAKTVRPAKPIAGAAKTKPATAAQVQSPASSGNSKPVLTVGSEKISAEEFEAFIEALPDQYKQQARGPMKRQVAQDLVRVRLLADEARRRGLDKDKTTQNRIAFTIDNMLAGAVYKELLDSTPIDDAAMRKYYDENKNQWEQSQARHILVRFKGSPAPLRPGQTELSDEEALAKTQDLRKKILAGEDFAALAKAESDDAGSGANGGELGSFKRGAMVPAFDQAAFSLPVGQVSEPIKTQFGYHIIKVDKRDTTTFDQAKPEIENKLRPEMARKALEAMLTNANVVYDDAYFGPEAAKPAPDAPAKPPIQTQPDNKK